MSDPITKFKSWWDNALLNTPLKHKNTVCVSTINADGFPSGRFVDLKAVNEDGFVFCTNLDSEKGKELRNNSKVALTFWWEHVACQVRVIGLASEISKKDADNYWQTRSRDAQITTISFKQSQGLESESELMELFLQTKAKIGENEVAKPEDWGGYNVKPISIEFLTFKYDRLHLREFYKKNENGWLKSLLQP